MSEEGLKNTSVFRIRREERVMAVVALIVIVALNGLFIYRLHDLFMQPGFGPYWKVFEREFHLAGYDPYTYLGITDWGTVYQVYRHPLLAFMIWPLYLLNEGLTWLFGINCVQYIVASVLTFCSLYSYLFIYRIHREVVGLQRFDAALLSTFFYSLAYIMLSVIVPDHFTLSMLLLLTVLYISGRCIQKGRKFTWWQSALFFYITAGVTLSNGIKVFLSGLFVNLRNFFRPKYLLLAVALPAALLWLTATWEYHTFVEPKEKQRQEEKIAKAKALAARVAKMSPEERAKFEVKKAKREKVLRIQAAKSGKPMEKEGFLRWTDITTDRWQTIYENLFGEALQFHQQYFLQDTLVHRPVFVKYNWWFSYLIEAVILLLFAAGVWCGRRSRFLWLCLSCQGFDLFLHLVLGFGINEVHIMAPHFMSVLPIAIAYLLKAVRGWRHQALRGVILMLTLYLFIYNGCLLTDFLLTPIRATL
jgi:hypothetical protein